MSDSVTTLFGSKQRTPTCVKYPRGMVAMFSTASPFKRSPNEDCYAVIPLNKETLILAVADGAGGHPNGGMAARLVIEAVVKEVTLPGKRPVRESIVNGFDAGQAAIVTQVPGAATTLIVVEITNRSARTYHVGDSGACVIGGRGKVKSYTIFHSPTGYAAEAGMLTEQQAMMHEHRHVVSNLMGDAEMSVEIGQPLLLAARDTIVVASDGLFDNLLRDEIGAISCRGPLADAGQNLIAAATARMKDVDPDEPGKADDLTILMYRQHHGQC